MSDLASIKRLIENSGNNFHARVARWFRDHGWHITVSPYYMDQSQSKSREIDLIAEKLWPYDDEFGRLEGYVAIRLFIECKFIADDAVFWFAPKDMDAAKQLVKLTHPFKEDHSYSKRHHYISGEPEVAKLFASNSSRASENDPFFKALNQVLNAFVSMRHGLPFHPDVKAQGRQVRAISIPYPVIVCSSFSKLYATKFLEDAEPNQLERNFQLEVRYAYTDKQDNSRSEYFLVDVVEFNQLEELEKSIDKDAEVATYLAPAN